MQHRLEIGYVPFTSTCASVMVPDQLQRQQQNDIYLQLEAGCYQRVTDWFIVRYSVTHCRQAFIGKQDSLKVAKWDLKDGFTF